MNFQNIPPAPFEDDHKLDVEPSHEAHVQTPLAELQIPRFEHSALTRLPVTVAVVEPYEEDVPSALIVNVGVPEDCVREDVTFKFGKLPA